MNSCKGGEREKVQEPGWQGLEEFLQRGRSERGWSHPALREA